MSRKHSLVGLGMLLPLALGGGCDVVGETERLGGALGEEMLAAAPNGAGAARTATPTGTIDTSNPFFLSLGTNGRACVSCHQADQGWSITPAGVRARFEATDGLDPLFRPHDGANSPKLDVATVEARRQAYSLMLERAVVRVGLPVRDTAEFVLAAVDDPHGHASAAQLSLFRRPLPIMNLRFVAAVNWDGRNTPDPTNMVPGLKNQSNGATVGHGQAAAPIDDATRQSIVDFELSLTTAQVFHKDAKATDAKGALGGPIPLLTAPFAIGMNAPTGGAFDRNVFRVFDRWAEANSWEQEGARREVYEGQQVFNTKTFTIDLPGGPTFEGTCSSCHNTPNVGSSSEFRMIDIGVSDPARRAWNVPLYTFQNKVTGEMVQTTDPGRALISGRWADMNKFKVPGLRGLAARAPYFHDGSARTIEEVVDFYKRRFDIAFSDGEKKKLVMFLESL